MKKKYKHTELSTEKFCVDCGRPLKKRIVEMKPTVNRCFKDHVKHVIENIDQGKFAAQVRKAQRKEAQETEQQTAKPRTRTSRAGVIYHK